MLRRNKTHASRSPDRGPEDRMPSNDPGTGMNLASFIAQAEQEIVADSVAFSRTLAPFSQADEKRVVDHIPQMLRAISADLQRPQSRASSIAKSQGIAAGAYQITDADEHGQQRAQNGLSIEQLMAEYRALRSSVLRLWAERFEPDRNTIADIGRFNEALDQAVAESVRGYAAETESRRQIFLAALGHDLRGPLNAVTLTASAILRHELPQIAAHTAVLSRSAKRMATLLETLLEYNIVSLGGGMILARSNVDLEQECREELDILRAAFHHTPIELRSQGNCHGDFDASRIREALGNLISNAAKHGVQKQPVRVSLEGTDAAVNLTVTNAVEEHIPDAELELLFEPLRRRPVKAHTADRNSLGLGLFITKEIAKAHGGNATVQCSGTTIDFTIFMLKAA